MKCAHLQLLDKTVLFNRRNFEKIACCKHNREVSMSFDKKTMAVPF